MVWIMSNAKYIQIAELFKRRVQSGDYSFNSLPGAQRLAAETGVSYLTARQAIQKLINDGVLTRLDTGRLEICNALGSARRKLNVVYLRSSFAGAHPVWDAALQQVAENNSCGFRTISYSHNDDPVIFEAIDGDFDLIFLDLYRTDDLFLEKLKKNRDRIVTLFQDLTAWGIRCVDGPGPKCIATMMAYLYKLGHRRIACFNTEPQTHIIDQRVEAWQNSLRLLGCQGDLLNYPVQAFRPPAVMAYDVMNRLFDEGSFKSTAIFTITVEAALGVLRSCYEHGVRIPQDLSVCSFGNPEKAQLAIPSISIINRPDPVDIITEVFRYYLGQGGDRARLMYRPEEYDALLVGESTGPAPENDHALLDCGNFKSGFKS